MMRGAVLRFLQMHILLPGTDTGKQQKKTGRHARNSIKGTVAKVSDEAAFCLIQRPYISKNSAYQAHFAQGITIIKC
ncbi:hypothetical protein [Enterobacter roggenkampii]|uniref:hypothetical protein n=1 Tax=Enterobacter roggenkampii TaxID=1812935 RepID=UPI001D0896A5|nr:hypothetical protein [Enterobacter roggenkampii]